MNYKVVLRKSEEGISEMIEEILEDHLLGRHMREAEKESPVVKEDALKYYAKLKKGGKPS